MSKFFLLVKMVIAFFAAYGLVDIVITLDQLFDRKIMACIGSVGFFLWAESKNVSLKAKGQNEYF